MENQLHKMKRIEIVVEGHALELVKDILVQAGGSGFTVIDNVSGRGHHGYHQGRLLFNEISSQNLVITVVPENRVDSILSPLLTYFKEHAGVVFVSDTEVLRAEYFAKAN